VALEIRSPGLLGTAEMLHARITLQMYLNELTL